MRISGTSATAGKDKIKKFLQEERRKSGKLSFSLLDLGCGKGTYGRMLDAGCYKVGIDAVDVKDLFRLGEVYDEFYQHDIRDAKFLKSLGNFDVITMGDVLEHLSFSDARMLLDSLETQCDLLVIAVPYLYPQYFKDNHWENHIQDDLTQEVFAERYPEFKLYSLHYRGGKPFYGYYTWRRD